MFGKKANKSEAPTDPEQVVSVIKNALDSQDFKYRYVDEAKLFVTSFMGDDLPIATNIRVLDGVIHFMLLLDLKTSPDNFSKVSWELNCINKQLMFGAFILDPDDGMISFEYGFPYVEADVSSAFILYFTKCMVDTVDAHDGDLKKIAETVKRDMDNMYL